MAETDITRMSSDYADNELELFRTTVSSGISSGIRSRGPMSLMFRDVLGSQPLLIQMDLIVDSESGRASSTDILNRADGLTSKKLKKSETENLLNRLVQDRWLDMVQWLSSLLREKHQALFCRGAPPPHTHT